MSVKLNKIRDNKGARSEKKRLGRGIGSGLGKTSGRGGKGQTARSGVAINGFEGGQTPLVRRLPKFGFTNVAFKTNYEVINLSDLIKFGADVSPEALYKKGFIKKNSLLKVLAKGTIDKAVTVKAHKFSEKAKQAIEKAGGKVEVIAQ